MILVIQSVFEPRGPAAKILADLGAPVIIALCIVTLIMLALIVWVALRHRGTLDEHAPADAAGGQSWILIGGFAIPAVILATIFIATLSTMNAFPVHDGKHPHPPDIIVTGHQWWWEVEYVGEAVCGPGSPDGHAFAPVDQRMTTANEIHIPVGLPVEISLKSGDVIHSFWVPQLHGKVDLVPGQDNRIRIVASQPGEYRGQCAEFCGEQHAHMILHVFADTPEAFRAWMTAQQAPARAAMTPQQKQGEDLFMTRACVVCHTIRGTPAFGKVGPDLTHIASRGTIAAGSYPNTKAYLMAWITHAQSLKPGAQMPDLTIFNGDDLHAVTAYLMNLK